MKTREFHYPLPQQLIAQKPCEIRSQSRLLHYVRNTGKISHHIFSDIVSLLNPGDLLVFNNTRVIPARLYGHKESGGKIEILIERVTAEYSCLAQIRASKSPKTGMRLLLKTAGDSSYSVTVKGRDNDLFRLDSPPGIPMAKIIEETGHMPLPPYIVREDDDEDFRRYQTVYANSPGAVAAPTAGLHFDESLLQQLEQKGVLSAYVTLHVGAGTFQPVRCEDIGDHRMHSELISVPQETVDQCRNVRRSGGRIIAVGTTSVRSLEAASGTGELQPFNGETDIFIYPGYEFRSVDAIITNFHLPESTLLMLVSAFAGKNEIMRCYTEAVAEEYRFFSYGDAMFIT